MHSFSFLRMSTVNCLVSAWCIELFFFLLPNCSGAIVFAFSACCITLFPTILFSRLKLGTIRTIVFKSEARRLVTFFVIITSIPCPHQDRDYPVSNETSRNHLSKSHSISLEQLARKCPKWIPDCPQEVYSRLFCQ
jgi:hypothetical protein